jgi:hypothetical protein
MASVTFESAVRGNTVEIPEEYRESFTSPIFVTITDTKYAGRETPPKILPRRGQKPITIEDFGEPFIDTMGWKFDRDEANER